MRTFLLVVTALCVCIGWIVEHDIKRIRAVGALGLDSMNIPDWRFSGGSNPQRPYGWYGRTLLWLCGDGDFEHQSAAFTKLRRLQISNLRDEQAHWVASLPELKELIAKNPLLTPAGFRAIRGMRQLITLDMGGMDQDGETQITDECLQEIANLRSLEGLYVAQSKVTDAGMEYLKPLRSLIWLDLTGTKITNRGAQALIALPNLKTLLLSDTGVTLDVLPLLAAMPKLEAVALDIRLYRQVVSADTSLKPSEKEYLLKRAGRSNDTAEYAAISDRLNKLRPGIVVTWNGGKASPDSN